MNPGRRNHGKVENQLYQYILQRFPDAQQGRLFAFRTKTVELDIFIPSLPLAIEYDGPHHRRRVKKDESKNYLLQQAGIYLIRVRYAGLPQISAFGCETICHNPMEGLDACFQQVQTTIERHFSLSNAIQEDPC